MWPILQLSLRQLASGWRLLLVFLLAALPIVVSLIFLLTDHRLEFGEAGDAFYDGLLVGAIMPILTMALATAALGNEIDDRTLGYLVLKPVGRWAIVMPKYLASISVGGPLLVASGVSATLISSSGDLLAGAATGTALAAGVVAYAAIFNWLGLVSRAALGFALIYVFIWEGLASTFLGGVRYLSVRAYSLAIMHGIDSESFKVFDGRVIELPAAVGGTVAVTVVFLFLTVRRLSRMDVP